MTARVLFVALALALPTAALATPASIECGSVQTETDTAVISDGQTTKYELSSDGYDPDSLIYVGFHANQAGCAVVQLSLHTLQGWERDGTNVGGDYVVAKVLLDEEPMWGHTTACKDNTGTFVPCLVFANNVDGIMRLDAHSYQLVLPVKEGDHRVRVVFAGEGDGPSHGAYVGGTVLTVQHP